MGRKTGPRRHTFRLYACLTFALVFLFQGPAYGIGGNATGTDPGDVQQWLAELEKRAPGPGEKAAQADSNPEALVSQSGGLDDTGSGTRWGPGYRDAQRISVDFYKIDLHNVFRLLGKVSHKNFVVDESVSGTLTLSLQDVPWTFVLDVIKNLKGLSSIERYNTIMVYPSDKEVTWAGEAGNTGTLAFEPKAVVSISRGPKLEIKAGHSVHQSPIDNVFKAEGLIRQAAEAERKGDFRKAIELYGKASDLWMENTSLAKKIASLALGKTGDELAALNSARRALRYAPKDAEAATLAAVALARMGKDREARAFFERALSAGKASEDTLYDYAVFSFSQGEYRQVLRLIARLEREYSLTPEVMMLRARSYEALDDRYRAAKEYRAIVNAGGSVPSKLRVLAQERMKKLSSHGGDHEAVPSETVQ